jgi:hypothetical protein
MICVALPSQAVSTSIRLVKIGTSIDSAPTGSRVVFRALARNRGPGTLDMFVNYEPESIRHLDPDRLVETCVVPASETGDFDNVSPDSPNCEWDSVPEGDRAIVKVVTWLDGSPGQIASITFCADNCKTARIRITD